MGEPPVTHGLPMLFTRSTLGGLWASVLGSQSSRAMAAARSPPVSGSRAVVVSVVAEGLLANGWVTQVISISKASQ